MTKEQCLAIQGLSKKQAATIKRYFWEAEKKNKECKLTPCETEEEVLSIVNSSFKNTPKEGVEIKRINLNGLSIEELEFLMREIPEIIAKKKADRVAELEAKIQELEALKNELTKQV